MIILNQDQTQKYLEWQPLIAALKAQFEGECVVPTRHHHDFKIEGERDATLLLMPAWNENDMMGIKLVTIIPENHKRGLNSVTSSYLLSSAVSGENIAMLDGNILTARRTAAASALASSYLSNKDAKIMTMVGTGTLSTNLIEAHASVRNLEKVYVWGRDVKKADAVCVKLKHLNVELIPTENLQEAVEQSDIISCATLSQNALVKGAWLKPGAHLDLVGAFTPDMRESDDEAIRCSRIFVDTMAGALKEAGDIVMPINDGVITERDIAADLFALCRDHHAGREDKNEITLFKSVGAALEDLAAAKLVYQSYQKDK